MLKRLLLVIPLGLFATAALSQDNTGWVTQCQPDLCTLSRGLAEEGTGKQMATLLVAVPKASEDLRFGLALPLGLALAPGARVVYADKSVDIPFEVCFPDGCRAMMSFADADFAALAANAAIDVQFFPYGASAPVALTAPVDGLAEAAAAAKETLASQP